MVMLGGKNQKGVPTSAEVSAFLGKGASLEGKMSFEGTFHIVGKYEGGILSGDSLVIAETAEVNAQIKVNNLVVEGKASGNIRANNLIVKGKVSGNIRANNRIEIHRSGEIWGDIQTPALTIMEGVLFEGKCRMGKREIKGHEKVSSRKQKRREDRNKGEEDTNRKL